MQIGSLVSGILKQDRLSISKAITLIESTLGKDKENARLLFRELHKFRPSHQCLRVGLTGSPGVGKSTLIESLGTYLTGSLGKHIAILAVDPSSPMSGGSVLGDKTRMQHLSTSDKAYIRPSPSKGDLGGVIASTLDSIRLYAGFDVVLIESVGVGQSELCLADLSDIFVLLVAPGAGDELQGIKKGITELADIILVNKCEQPLSIDAKRTLFEYKSAMKLRKPLYQNVADPTKVMPISALSSHGITEAWKSIEQLANIYSELGVISKKRGDQASTWARNYAVHLLTQKFYEHCKEHPRSIREDEPISCVAEHLLGDFIGH